MKHPVPNSCGTSAEFWKAAGEERLTLPHCNACALFQWPPRAACVKCGAGLSWREASGCGSIASWSVVRRAVHPELKGSAPYIVAFIELDERVRLFTNIVDAAPEDLRVGARVRARFEPALDAAIRVPVFVLDTES